MMMLSLMDHPHLKPIRLSAQAHAQCRERGASPEEVEKAVREGDCEPAKRGRSLYRYNVEFNRMWHDHRYAVKQVAAVVAEEADEPVVATVYTFYF